MSRLVQAWLGYELGINRNGVKDAKESDKFKVTSDKANITNLER